MPPGSEPPSPSELWRLLERIEKNIQTQFGDLNKRLDGLVSEKLFAETNSRLHKRIDDQRDSLRDEEVERKSDVDKLERMILDIEGKAANWVKWAVTSAVGLLGVIVAILATLTR